MTDELCQRRVFLGGISGKFRVALAGIPRCDDSTNSLAALESHDGPRQGASWGSQDGASCIRPALQGPFRANSDASSFRIARVPETRDAIGGGMVDASVNLTQTAAAESLPLAKSDRWRRSPSFPHANVDQARRAGDFGNQRRSSVGTQLRIQGEIPGTAISEALNMLLLIILLILLFGFGGGFYGYRSGYYGGGGMSVLTIVLIVLVIWILLGGGMMR
jgi:hypothetical protein